MKNTKKIIFKILFWLIGAIIVSILYRSSFILPKFISNDITPRASFINGIQIWIAAPIVGLIAGLCILFIDFVFIRQKIENQTRLLSLKFILLLVFIIFISYIQQKFF